MTTKVFLWAVFTTLFMSASLTSACAQSVIPDCGRNAACKTLAEQGKEQSSAGNLPEALRLYKQAYETEADPALLFSIGRVLHKQGKTDEAARHYERFLSSGLQDEKQRRRAQEYLSQTQHPSAPSAPTSPATAELTPPTPAQKSQPAQEPKPVYKKWWFWTILGTVAAAGIAGGIAGGVIANNPLPGTSITPFEAVN